MSGRSKEELLAILSGHDVGVPSVKLSAEELKAKFSKIDHFSGVYQFVSNDFLSSVEYNGVFPLPSASHAILLAKYGITYIEVLMEHADAPVAAAKELEAAQELPEWKEKRRLLLERILRDKFRRNQEIRAQLCDTGDRQIEWANSQDSYLGTVRGHGQNHMGRILMQIRQDVKDGLEMEAWLYFNHHMEREASKRPRIILHEQKEGEASKEYDLLQIADKRAGEGGERERRAFFLLGKLKECDVQPLHPSVSRRHACIFVSAKGVQIFDMASSAGTFKNGERLKASFYPVPIMSGDEIRLGASTRKYIVEIDMSSVLTHLQNKKRTAMREQKDIQRAVNNPLEEISHKAKQQRTVFVGNLDYNCTQWELRDFFQDCGRIEEVRFPSSNPGSFGGTSTDNQAGKEREIKASRGIAFVTFADDLSATRALGSSGRTLGDRKVKVATAQSGANVGKEGDKLGAVHKRKFDMR